MMSEAIRTTMAQSSWEITKGHIRASVALRAARRETRPPTTREDERKELADWQRFETAANAFIVLVEGEGWHE